MFLFIHYIYYLYTIVLVFIIPLVKMIRLFFSASWKEFVFHDIYDLLSSSVSHLVCKTVLVQMKRAKRHLLYTSKNLVQTAVPPAVRLRNQLLHGSEQLTPVSFTPSRASTQNTAAKPLPNTSWSVEAAHYEKIYRKGEKMSDIEQATCGVGLKTQHHFQLQDLEGLYKTLDWN